MKRMTKEQLRSEANKIKKLWIMHYSFKNAKKLSLELRRLFLKEKK